MHEMGAGPGAGARPGTARPSVFVEKVKGAFRITATDRDGPALGLVPGLPLADARARIGELDAIEMDPAADRAWLDRLADGCTRYTPLVEPDPPEGLLLDITGCTHPYGGAHGLLRDAERRLARLGLAPRLALGDTPSAAAALARHDVATVGALPIAALRIDADRRTALRRAGLKTIGDLAERPTAPLAARFGEEVVAALDRLLGRADSRLVPRRPPPALVVEQRFAEPLARTEHALAVIAELLGQACEQLRERHAGGRRFEVSLFRSDGLVRGLAVETGRPTRDPESAMRLVRERLDSLSDPLDPGFGFDLIRLALPVIEPLAPQQLEIVGRERTGDAIDELIDRLTTRLGRGSLRRFARRDTHIPECAATTLPATEASPSLWPPQPTGEPPLRPFHLFDPPQPIEVTADVPDGPPRRFRWRRTLHEVVLAEGPERIAAEWWRVPVARLPQPMPSRVQPARGRDDHPIEVSRDPGPPPPRPAAPPLTRDYFRVEDSAGHRFWLFRHGLYGDETVNPGWYVHGMFA